MTGHCFRRARHVVSRHVLVVLFLAVSGTALANDDVSGYVTLHTKVNNHHDGGSAVVARVRYETPRIEGNRAVVTVEGNYYDRELVLEETYIDRRISPQLKMVAGIDKKILGLEYSENKAKRYTIHRSPIYQKMESLGLVGRQLTLRLIGTPETKPADNMKWSTALGTDGSRNFNLSLSFQRQVNDFGVGAWLLAEARKSSTGYRPALVNVLSLWLHNTRRRIALEIFQGIDPERSEFVATLGQRRNVSFSGAKLELVRRISLGKQYFLSPLVQASWWLDDVTEPGKHSWQTLLGVRLGHGKLWLSINGEAKGGRAYDERICHAEALLTF